MVLTVTNCFSTLSDKCSSVIAILLRLKSSKSSILAVGAVYSIRIFSSDLNTIHTSFKSGDVFTSRVKKIAMGIREAQVSVTACY